MRERVKGQIALWSGQTVAAEIIITTAATAGREGGNEREREIVAFYFLILPHVFWSRFLMERGG